MFFSSLNQHYDIIICVYWFKLISQVSDVAHGPLVFIKYLFKNNISTTTSVHTDEISLITFHTIMCKNALVLSTTWLKTHDINIHNTSLSYESLELVLTVTVPQIQVLFFLHGKTCWHSGGHCHRVLLPLHPSSSDDTMLFSVDTFSKMSSSEPSISLEIPHLLNGWWCRLAGHPNNQRSVGTLLTILVFAGSLLVKDLSPFNIQSFRFFQRRHFMGLLMLTSKGCRMLVMPLGIITGYILNLRSAVNTIDIATSCCLTSLTYMNFSSSSSILG